jgi:predicted RNase H-like nuclease (RuvC/YqgF family)
MSDLNLQAALEEVSKLAAKLKEERDEARAEIKKLRLYAQREAEHHDQMVGELERVYAESDEARELAGAMAHLMKNPPPEVDQAVSKMLLLARWEMMREEANP